MANNASRSTIRSGTVQFTHRPCDKVYNMARPSTLLVIVAALACSPCLLLSQQNRPVLAVFAHPDDERVVAPLLARLAREGREVHLVIATDGSKGVRPHAGIPAGPQLAAA